ncbi:MAG: DNA methyltransferase [Aquificaceae bacterium]|nr:site-specific DNA-methyltransferase [Aquificaceae bacterium]MDW8424269.1 DNA methyltransferase [Aquificaceae bacterium]
MRVLVREHLTEYVSFRDLYVYPSTNYGLFGLYRYPAKFIPQVVLYAIREYAQSGDVVFDPFAGNGTVGIACRLLGHDYELWDINPMLSFLHNFCHINSAVPTKEVIKSLEEVQKSRGVYIPHWDNITYWYPESFLEELGRLRYAIEKLENYQVKLILLLAFLKTAKYFSYADEKVHKLYRSKKAKEKVEKLLKDNWRSFMRENLRSNVVYILEKLQEYLSEKPKEVQGVVMAGVDTLRQELHKDVDILLTSPPYLQAQEYIRSTKLELFWLGHTQEQVSQLSKREIPYRKDVLEVSIESETYHVLYEAIREEKLREVYKKYFMSVVGSLQRLSEKVRKRMLIFVGPVYSGDVKVPIDNILLEHFTYLGWKHVRTYVDKVKSRVMFNTKDFLNPASKRENKRMETEHLLVIER